MTFSIMTYLELFGIVIMNDTQTPLVYN